MSDGPHRKGYDAVVIGAGVVGLACAWRAARRGLSVLVVDAAAPGAGASGVAAGMLAPVTEADWGERALLALNLAGAERWPGFADELEARTGASSGFVRSGALVVAVDRDDGEELRRLLAFQRSLGLNARWLSGRECRRLEGGLSPAVPGGIHAPGDHAADPRATVAALRRALELEGGKIRCGAPASVVVRGDRVAGVEVAGSGVTEAEHVIVAAGAWSGRIEGLPADGVPPVRPVKGQILRLRQRGSSPRLAEHVVRTPRCYVVTRPAGEVVVGATVEDRGFDDEVTADGVFGLLEAAREVLPDVGELRWVEARAGLRPGTPDNAPLIGQGALPGLIWATGHHRNGVLLAPITADAVAGLLAGEAPAEAVRGFGPERFNPQPPAPAAAVLAGAS